MKFRAKARSKAKKRRVCPAPDFIYKAAKQNGCKRHSKD